MLGFLGGIKWHQIYAQGETFCSDVGDTLCLQRGTVSPGEGLPPGAHGWNMLEWMEAMAGKLGVTVGDLPQMKVACP
jgi:hypothetical protein